MLWNSHTDRFRQLFDGQFEADGTHFLYRRSMTGASICVTAAERVAFISAYARRLRLIMWSIVPATLALIGLLVLFGPDPSNSPIKLVIDAGVALILIPPVFAAWRAWNAPARVLVTRPAIGTARTCQQVDRILLQNSRYVQYGASILAAVLLAWHLVVLDHPQAI